MLKGAVDQGWPLKKAILCPDKYDAQLMEFCIFKRKSLKTKITGILNFIWELYCLFCAHGLGYLKER